MKDWNSSMAISWKSTKLFCNILLESRSKKQCCCQFDDGLRTASCTKLYEIAVRRCMKCCTKSVFKPLREGILTAGPFENKGFRTCAGVRSGLYFLPHGESTSFTSTGGKNPMTASGGNFIGFFLKLRKTGIHLTIASITTS